MTASAKRLLEEVLALSPEDRQWILRSLQLEQDESAAFFSTEEMDEFARRVHEVATGSVEGIPVETVMSELRERTGTAS